MTAADSDDESAGQESKLVAFCVIAALVGIAVLLAYARTNAPVEKSLDELSSEDAGHLVLVKARVESASLSQNGNAVVRICARACATVFIPKQLVEKMNASTLAFNSLRRGAVISVEGVVEERAGGFSLSVLTPDAVEFLGFQEG
jgi:hypothetical protein